jgi:hypothetical protein
MDKMTHEIKKFKNTNLPNYQLKHKLFHKAMPKLNRVITMRFVKRLQTNDRRTDGRQVMAITHMAFWPGELIKVWIGLFRTGQ